MNKRVENASPAELKRRGMSAMEIWVARHSRPVSDDIGSRRSRRRLVVATYAAWIAIAALVKLLSFAFPSSIVLLVVLLVACLSLQALWVGRRNYVNTPALLDVELDERLVQTRDAAFRIAFRIFAPTAIVGWVVSMIATKLQPNDTGLLDEMLIFLGVVLLGTTLPTAIVAWREPDPDEPEKLPA